MSTAGGVVLAGGRSSRMGTAKADLDWHGNTLLFHTAAVLRRAVPGPVVVVAVPGQPLPELPPGVTVARDPVPGRGPLQGIATGLAAVGGRAPAAFVCATDMPLLHPSFVCGVLAARAEAEVALPVVRGHRQPLAAAYRTTLAERFVQLLRAGVRRLGELERHCRVATLTEAALLADPRLARLDPGLDSVLNVNTAAELAAARGRPLPEVLVCGPAGEPTTVRAATLAAAVAALGLPAARWAEARVGGAPATDPRYPLVAGDRITFRPVSPATGRPPGGWPR